MLVLKILNFQIFETMPVGCRVKSLIQKATTMDLRENAISPFDRKYSFWANLVQKFEIVSLS